MKEAYISERRNGWILWVSIAAILLVGIGIFFYYTFLRQSKAELIEAVPTDAMFLFEVNDNDDFANKVASLQPFFNEAFTMDALPAFETVYHKLPNGAYDITLSGHQDENGTYLLFNTRFEKATFKKLLRALCIDPANFTSFEQCKIYTYGTNYKSLKFVYVNHILTVSDNIELVKKAIIQHTHPKNLFYDKEFKQLYDLTQKNKKQNWIMLNNKAYYQFLGDFFSKDVANKLTKVMSYDAWSAYQIKISNNELFLTGYITATSDNIAHFKSLASKDSHTEAYLPFNTYTYSKRELENYTACSFTMAKDSLTRFDYLLVLQDSTKQAFRPLGNTEQAEEFRSTHPSGIYSTTDSTIQANLKDIPTQFQYFIERNGTYLFAESEDAIVAYNKEIATNGHITDSRYYQFSNYNISNNNLTEFTFFNLQNGKHLQEALSPKGKAALTAKRLGIFSMSCTGITDEYIVASLYLHFTQK